GIARGRRRAWSPEQSGENARSKDSACRQEIPGHTDSKIREGGASRQAPTTAVSQGGRADAETDQALEQPFSRELAPPRAGVGSTDPRGRKGVGERRRRQL